VRERARARARKTEQYTLDADPADSSSAAVAAAAAADPPSLAAASADAITPECKKTCDGLRGLEHEVLEHIAANWSHGLHSCTRLVLETSLPEDKICIHDQARVGGYSQGTRVLV